VASGSADGGKIVGAGNGGEGGNGGSAEVEKASIGGDTTSTNVAIVKQSNEQKIVLIPIAVQKASTRFNAFTLGLH
jgi:hypothetical protein